MRLSLVRADKRSVAAQKKRARRKVASRRRLAEKRRLDSFEGHKSHTLLRAPFAINVSSKNNRRHTLRFFAAFRRFALADDAPLTVDLSDLEYIMPSAAALLVAEFDRAKRIMKDDFNVRLLPSKSERINNVLDQIGFSAICGTKLGTEDIDSSPDELVRHWRYATGVRINDQTERAFTDIQGRLAPNVQESIWVGVSEAIGNAALHAYLEPRGTDQKRLGTKRWWMLSQMRDGVLSITVADLGIGIPRSLPLKWPRSSLGKILDGIVGKGADERAIRAAMVVGATSTGEKHRGKGLPQIWHEIRGTKDAMITIYSNRGNLRWDGRKNVEESQEFADSIFGTVISWSVPVQEISDGE